ncbi:MAG: 3-isopropylmalate dehydrogenase [Bowdeniella nasicola]|nr:3-isopropylmalate dehydrogenase [Bowdeniella nasicola]
MTTIDLAVIGGDGIGPEVTAQALRVAHAAVAGSGITLTETPYDLGAQRYLSDGHTLDVHDIDNLRRHDAIVLGAIGDPSVTPGILEREILLRLRFALDHYVNLRPAILYPGVPSPLAEPGKIDFVVVREGTEGLYCGNGGVLRAGTDAEVATETSVNTAYGVRRLVTYAFELAARRERRHLTLVHKANVLVNAGGLWRRLVEEIGRDFPEVTTDYLHVDAATIFLVTEPSRFDVIVTDNLFGDILTDEAGAVTGGVGLAASANLNPSGASPSMFEPVHGSAPDIAGHNIADPLAAIGSMALMFDHLNLTDAAQAIRAAVRRHMADRAEAAAAGRPYEVRTDRVGEEVSALLNQR